MTPTRWILAACLMATATIAAAAETAAFGPDRFAVGGRVLQTEPVDGDVLAAGGRVLVDARIGHNVRAAGGRVEIGEKALVEGNASLAGGRIVVRGPVKGHLQAAGGRVLIDSAIDGDVFAACGKLELGPHARIGGKLTYRAQEEMTRDSAAQVAGAIDYRPSARDITHPPRGNRWTRGWLWTAGLALLAILLAGALPAASERVGGQLRAHPWLSLLAGLVVLICMPVAAVIVMLTIIGIPLGLLAILAYLALMLIGYVAAAVTLGEMALARAQPGIAAPTVSRMLAAALAVLVLALLARVPFVGGFVVLATLLFGIGALVLAMKPFSPAAPAAPAAA